jgi:hemerythrin-like domain-containing protein
LATLRVPQAADDDCLTSARHQEIAMCDYCGCRTQPSIARLGEEHDRIESVAEHLRAAHTRGDRDGAAAIASALLTLLVPHVAREEGALFPELTGAGASHHVQRLEDEHEQFDLALRPIAGGVASASEWAALPRAIDGLRAHIWTEEFDVFPAALQLLDPSAWQRVEEGCGTSRASPPSEPERRSEQRVTYR